MCLPQWKRAFSFAMPCQGWSLHLQKALHASCKMKIISLPTDYITLPLLHGLPLLLIELRGVGAPHFNTRGPYSGPSGSSLINTNHPQGRGWGLQRCFNLTLGSPGPLSAAAAAHGRVWRLQRRVDLSFYWTEIYHKASVLKIEKL